MSAWIYAGERASCRDNRATERGVMLPLAIAGTGLGVIGLLVVILLVILILRAF